MNQSLTNARELIHLVVQEKEKVNVPLELVGSMVRLAASEEVIKVIRPLLRKKQTLNTQTTVKQLLKKEQPIGQLA